MRLFLLATAAALILPCVALANMPAAPAAPAAQTLPADIPLGKLPDTAKPLGYRIDLTVNPDTDRFSGHTEIDVTLKSASASFYMHGRDLNITRAVAVQGGKEIAVTWQQMEPLGVARVTFATPLKAGKVTLKFDYDAPFGDGPAGLYRIKVADQWYAWSQLQSIDARAVFPSFDEPGFKTPFTVSLTTKADAVAASNAPETGSVKVGDMVKHTFMPTVPLPTYLVAFVVGPFAVAEGKIPATPQRSHELPIRILATQPGKDRLHYALEETKPIIKHLEAYFDMGFPYPKLDQIASPVMPGAMENAGADIYGDNILLLDDHASTTQKQTFGMVVAHELAHQWFGDYVTPAWWDDIWLNESFANWMGYRIGDEWRPELNIGIGATNEGFVAMNTDSLKVGRPIHQPIANNSDIDSAFDTITYGKGGHVVAMVAAYLGDNTFRDGVRLHMSRHPHGNATTEAFFGALADAAKEPRVLAAMKSFIGQQGVPVIDFRHDGGKVIATQSRYSKLGTTLDAQTWIVPMCIRQDAARACTLLDKTTQEVTMPGTGAFMPNAGGTGYYRFNLTPGDWDALIATGATLPAGEGIAATDSLWAQFSAGRIDAARLITAARVMAANTDSNVAVDGGDRMDYFVEHGFLGKADMPDYQRVMASIYAPRLNALGFNPAVGAHKADSPDLQKMRQSLVKLVADDARDRTVRKTLDAAAVAYLAGDTGALDQSYMARALAVHVEEGGTPAAKAMLERVLTTKDELFRARALGAVTAGATKETADWLLGGGLDDARLRTPDKLALMGGLFAYDTTRDQAYEWLKTNYEAFSARTGIFAAGKVASLPGTYCSAEKADEIERIMRPKVQAAGRGELSFNRMLENMRNCSALKDAKGAEVRAAFKAAR